MQLNDNKNNKEISLHKASTLVLEEKKVLWIDTAYNNKRLLVVTTTEKDVNEVLLYSIQSENHFNFEVSILVPYYKCNKALFTKINNELFIVSLDEFRIIEWSIYQKEIKHSIVIESTPPIIITNIKLNLIKLANVSSILFVESDDNNLRVFNMDSNTCLYSLNKFSCWALSNSGQWYITSIYDANKNYFNIHSLSSSDKLPISCLFAKNDKKIVKIDITKSNVYVIALNENGDIFAYTIWNMESVAFINLHKESNNIINNSLPLFACSKQYNAFIILDNDEIILSAINGNKIEIKHKEKLNHNNQIISMAVTNFNKGIMLYNKQIVEYWI